MDSDIKINLGTVSRKHAEIYRDSADAKVWLHNLNRQNETLLNGKQVDKRAEVTEGSIVGIHGRFFRFEYGAPLPLRSHSPQSMLSFASLLPSRHVPPPQPMQSTAYGGTPPA